MKQAPTEGKGGLVSSAAFAVSRSEQKN